MNALAGAITLNGQPILASYDATGSATITTRPGCTIARPDGDLAGQLALRDANSAGHGCIGFGRLSAEPTRQAIDPITGMNYLPFARDGMSYAVANGGSVSRRLSEATLKGIYTCQIGGFLPLLPAFGSQLRSDWLAALGIDQNAVPACVQSTANGQPIRENDASVLTATAIAPFTVSQYIAQATGMGTDTRGGAALATVTGTTGGDGRGPLVANAAYLGGVSAVVTGDLPRQLTLPQVQRIYRCLLTQVAENPVTPMLPAPGPVRAAWLARVGITEAELSAGDYPCVRSMPYTPNDARSLPADAMLPYDITQYARQIQGDATDLRGSATMIAISDGGAGPAPRPFTLNAGYGAKMVHRVYNVVPYQSLLVSPYREIFLGASSLICQHGDLIERHGFLSLPPGTCGASEAVDAAPQSAGMLAGPAGTMSTMGAGDVAHLVHGNCTFRGHYANTTKFVWVKGSIDGGRCWVIAQLKLISYEYGYLSNMTHDHVYVRPGRPLLSSAETHESEFWLGFLQGGIYQAKLGSVVYSLEFRLFDLEYGGGSDYEFMWGAGPANWCDNWVGPTSCPAGAP